MSVAKERKKERKRERKKEIKKGKREKERKKDRCPRFRVELPRVIKHLMKRVRKS